MAGLIPPLPITGLPGVVAKNVPQAAAEKVSALQLIHEAGISGTTREGEPADRVALAIMHRESGGQADVVNKQPCSEHDDHAVGLMQICCPMHMPVADAKDPRKNLAKTKELYTAAGNSFAKDWKATYRPGEWRTAKDIQIQTGGVANPVDAVTGAISGVVDAALGPVDEIASALLSADTWFRVGKGLIGGSIVLIGAAALAAIALRPLAKGATQATRTANQAVNTAAKARNLVK